MSDTAHNRDTITQSAEILRMVLPLLSRHKIPATPENYTTWFHYVLGDIQELNNKIDTHIKASQPFSMEFCETLYRKYIAPADLEHIEAARDQLITSIIETNGTLGETGESAERFGQMLDNLNTSCTQARSVTDILGVVKQALNETQDMKNSMDQMRAQFDARTEELNKLRDELNQVRHQASLDPLTSLANRATFFDTLEEIISTNSGNPISATLVMLDIDHFKKVNDTYGHLVGDKVIRFVADVLRKSTKGQDTAARYGGEEFGLILPETPLQGGLRLAENIRMTICSTNLVKSNGESLGKITISGGVAEYQAGESVQNFVDRADKALYESKSAGRNRITRTA
ncbi:MAG: GGDEF domain-containing protein [Chromatiales bacterium]|nr:GGDEF domain-containing protein [Chromatiales bacterium]